MDCKVCGAVFLPDIQHLSLANKCLACSDLICADCASNHRLCLECQELDCAYCLKRLYQRSIQAQYCRNCDLAVHPACYQKGRGICRVCRLESPTR